MGIVSVCAGTKSGNVTTRRLYERDVVIVAGRVIPFRVREDIEFRSNALARQSAVRKKLSQVAGICRGATIPAIKEGVCHRIIRCTCAAICSGVARLHDGKGVSVGKLCAVAVGIWISKTEVPVSPQGLASQREIHRIPGTRRTITLVETEGNQIIGNCYRA